MYKRFQELMVKIADVNYATAVLMWDQETYMPKDGEHYRSQQISTLSGIAHDLFTSKELIELVATLQEDASLNEDQKLNVVETARVLNKKKKVDDRLRNGNVNNSVRNFHGLAKSQTK